ncbi:MULTISPECIES: RDD family protein [Chryseobacterium]|uniref:RDD family n=1 Tax=Chryseobacterium taihuense TaxID=1141221 RepID=A0A4U8WG82_9FLAO|nr:MULTISPECIES: RDD family protein [Chryseobacterium]QQV01551.1 RDD family protein [Chryseobacterium sp. FDAARGOS 1104]VFB05253.1 RDD family [Chryseobacterium taihuense]
MMKHLRIVEYNKASIGIRFINFVIDRIVIYILFFLFGLFSAGLFEFFGVEFFIDITYQLASLSKFEDILITLATYLVYIFIMEYFTKGRTLGKYITGTKVMSLDGSNPRFYQYLIRTLSRIVPFDALSFFGVNGWHDSWSDTRVINLKKYNAELQRKRDIDEIGSKEIA